ncbi:uncharacterized protein LOC134780098 [Penaeus indicus]|uniref:uncharacterized protein LOC134780098 n=1 Tax=Penaeus indicus TaxID=29960 RepID=UPI00300C714A
MLQSDSNMLMAVITGLVIFTVGQASPPLLVSPSSRRIFPEGPAWVTTDKVATDLPDLNFGTRSPFISEDISTTWDPDISTDVFTTASDETRATTTEGAAEGGSKPGTVVNCFCDAGEVYVNGVCRSYSKKPIAEKRVIIKDLECDTESGVRMLNFSREQFILRDRGDTVLSKEVVKLGSLRIKDYCITYSLDEHRERTWTVKVCVDPPKVPRCCPPGQSMKDNVCRSARTPEPLAPPISANPYGPAISWPHIETYEKPLNCSVEPMKDLPLIPRVSYLASHTKGLVHIWNAKENDYKFQYTYDPKFCVDGRQNLDGSASYSVKVCFESPMEQHQRLCSEKVCVRKCCAEGEIVQNYLHLCVRSLAAEFAPRMNTEYNRVIGKPICDRYTHIIDFQLLPFTGYLYTRNTTLPPSDYCIDKFSDREGNISDGALACINFSTWKKAQKIVFLVCMTISLVFLLIIVVCYCAAPIMLKNKGWYHLCYVASLIIAYFSEIMLQLPSSVRQPISCIGFAILMQFGYLSAFFWLSIFFFDVWRIFRSLNNKLRPPRPIPPYVYHIYAWGGPLVICSVTLGLQYVDADDVPSWLIKPHLGEYKCWFGEDMEKLVFFYLYIAILLFANCLFIGHTYWVKRKMDKTLAALRVDKKGNGEKTSPVVHSKQNYYSEFKTKFSLLALMSSCWVADVLSWQIPPPELWALTDTLNTLQGFFIFVIFMQDRQKRQHLKEKLLNLLRFFENIFK